MVALLFSWLHLVAVLSSPTELQPADTGTGNLAKSEDDGNQCFITPIKEISGFCGELDRYR